MSEKMTFESAQKTISFLEAPYSAISKEAAINKSRAEGFLEGYALGEVYREALEKITNEDYRGNRPHSALIAEAALAKGGKDK